MRKEAIAIHRFDWQFPAVRTFSEEIKHTVYTDMINAIGKWRIMGAYARQPAASPAIGSCFQITAGIPAGS